MPKIIDHDQRRDEIALAACRAVGRWGFDGLTVARIAREADCTTGMIAHYFDTKQDIILAALNLISERINRRLSERLAETDSDLADILTEALPIDPQRMMESTVWIGFWGQVPVDPDIRAINDLVHVEWTELIRRCVRDSWPETATWTEERLHRTCRAIQLFLNGVAASAITSAEDWPASEQVMQLKDHLARLRRAE